MTLFSIKLYFIAVTLALICSATFMSPASAGNGNNKAVVCHVTGNGNVKRQNVNENAVPAHINHGDYLPPEYYEDNDGDMFGDEDAEPIELCHEPSPLAGVVDNNFDCDDTDQDINPGATEVIGDGLDNDCNPDTPDDAPLGTCPCGGTDGIYATAIDEFVALGTETSIEAATSCGITPPNSGEHHEVDGPFGRNTVVLNVFIDAKPDGRVCRAGAFAEISPHVRYDERITGLSKQDFEACRVLMEVLLPCP